MAALNKLSAVSVRVKGAGKYEDGGGLRLVKASKDAGKWVYRFTVFGRRREMGLGALSDVSLRQARELASEWRSILAGGKDPIIERARKERDVSARDVSLGTIATEAFEARKAELKGDGIAGRWFSPLAIHVLPKLGKVPVTELHQNDIRDVLAPIWHNTSDPAQKALYRLGIVLRFAAAKGIDVDLQATAKAKELLGKSRHVVEHIPSMPWMDVPAFYASLDEDTVTNLALKLVILTGLRSKTVRMAHVDQFDDGVWTIPGENLKGRKGKTADQRIPVTAEMQAVIDKTIPYRRDGHVFPAPRGGSKGPGFLGDVNMIRLMERRGLDARPHGFRSTLRVWLSECTQAPFEVAELMIGHIVGTAVT
ncbi:MAG: integrase family protein, partial [Albidovulum sp.]